MIHDLRAWWPKVRRGGILAGHDYIPAFKAYYAVQEFGRKMNLPVFKTDEKYGPQKSMKSPSFYFLKPWGHSLLGWYTNRNDFDPGNKVNWNHMFVANTFWCLSISICILRRVRIMNCERAEHHDSIGRTIGTKYQANDYLGGCNNHTVRITPDVLRPNRWKRDCGEEEGRCYSPENLIVSLRWGQRKRRLSLRWDP